MLYCGIVLGPTLDKHVLVPQFRNWCAVVELEIIKACGPSDRPLLLCIRHDDGVSMKGCLLR